MTKILYCDRTSQEQLLMHLPKPLVLTLLAIGLGCSSAPNAPASSPSSSSSDADSTGPVGDSTGRTTAVTASTTGPTSGPVDPTFSSLTEAGDPICGDGIVEGDEVCDDGVNDGSYGGCIPTCNEKAPHCGDGVIQPKLEACDYGTYEAVPECNVVCQVPGSILETVTEEFDTGYFSPYASGVKVIEQGDELVAVFGGGSTTYWRLAPDPLDTNDIKTTTAETVDAMTFNLSGLVDMGGTNLLVAGDGVNQVFVVDTDLTVAWHWNELALPTPNTAFIGAAPLPNGAVVGGTDRNTINQMEASSYWAVAVSPSGNDIWTQIETINGDDDIYGRDLRGLSTGDAVLLTDGLNGGATFRIYDTLGQIVLTTEIPGTATYRDICVGENGFYLYDAGSYILTGFDNEGEPTINAAGPPLLAGEQGTDSVCAARQDGSPLIAAGVLVDGAELVRIIGFDQEQPIWTGDIALANGSHGFEKPFVYIDEANHRAIIFIGGSRELEANVRFVSAVSIAI